MASTSNSTETPSSPPPETLPPPESSLRNPLPPELEPPKRHYALERVRKRRRIEEAQDKSLIHGFELVADVTKILTSNDTSLLEEIIKNFVKFRKPSTITVFRSLAHHYPNAFALKLAKLLQLHPPLPIRNETVSILLRILKKSGDLNSTILIELKEPLLNSLEIESDDSVLPTLCKVIGFVASSLYQYPLGGWVELLQYVCVCFSGGLKLTHMKALLMLGELPVEVVENRDFWLDYGNYDVLFSNLLKFVNSQDQELQDLTFKASLKVMKMSKDLKRAEVCNSLLYLLLCFINLEHGEKEEEYGEEEDLLEMVKGLLDLARSDIEEIFNGKESDVFWCMLRVVEIEDASNELTCVAVSVIKELKEANPDGMYSVIQKFSDKEVERVISVSMGMMSCVVDDPFWHDIDNKDCEDAGLTENFNCGKFLLNLLSLDGDECVFVPIAMKMIERKYAIHGDWKVRYAAMLIIGTIAERHFEEDMIRYIEQVLSLVHKSLNDTNPQVLWATMHAIRWLSEYRQVLKFGKFHLKFLCKLIPISKTSLCSRVQAYAVIAIRFLVTNCGLEKILPLGEDVLVLLLVLLKHEKQKLKEEALEALKLIAAVMPAITFCQNHYDSTMTVLTTILFDDSSSSSLFFRAKCLECMGTLVRNFGQDKLKENEVDVLVESLMSIERNLKDTDHLARYEILKALDQFCRCGRVNIDNFFDQIKPMLLSCAKLGIGLTDNMPLDLSLDDYKYLITNLRVLADQILSRCSAKKIIPTNE